MRQGSRSLNRLVLLLLASLSGAGCGSSRPGVADAGGAGGSGGAGGGAGSIGGQCPSIGSGTSGDPNAAATWSKSFTSSKWLGANSWTALTLTIAVDSAERVYLTDSDNIFQADASGVQKLYAKSSLDQDFGATAWGISALDVSPEGRLFALVDLSSSTFTTTLFAADASGHLRPFADFKPFWPFTTVISAVSSDYVLAPFDNLYCVTSNGMAALYGAIPAQYPAVSAWDTYGCSSRGITNEINGSYLYYLPGCNGSPLVGGRTDGTRVSELWSPRNTSEVPSSNFWSLARAPRGGAIVNAGTTVFYVDELEHVPLNITPAPVFEQCAVGVGLSSTLYFVCVGGDVYRVTPTP
jgi:hypothetical protein